MTTASIIAAVLLGVVSVFQIALALGLPAGRAAWGGRHEGKLPPGLRVASGIAGVFLYPIIILLVLTAGGAIDARDPIPKLGATGMWILTGLFTVGTIANLASRSKPERWWGLVSATIAICCGIVAGSL
ncbi:MAG TPA: hypothetical protein VLS86_06520 [Acidimicrobiia bacterium]|nr:hypothetical protein [Acidimicrobiia bacterium]